MGISVNINPECRSGKKTFDILMSTVNTTPVERLFFSMSDDKLVCNMYDNKIRNHFKKYNIRMSLEDGGIIYDNIKEKPMHEKDTIDMDKLDLFLQEMYLEFEEYFVFIANQDKIIKEKSWIVDDEFEKDPDVSPFIFYMLSAEDNMTMENTAKSLTTGFMEYLEIQRYDIKEWGITEFNKLKYIVVAFCREHICKIINTSNGMCIVSNNLFADLLNNYIYFYGFGDKYKRGNI